MNIIRKQGREMRHGEDEKTRRESVENLGISNFKGESLIKTV